MSISIKNPDTVKAVEELKSLLNKGLTETIDIAVNNELNRIKNQKSIKDGFKSLRDRLASIPDTGQEADKAFFDDMGGQ